MPINQYIYLASILIAFLSSLTSFRLDYSFPMKLLSVLIGLTFAVEIAAVAMERARISNFWLYNVFALVEFWFYGYFYLRLIKGARSQILLKAFLIAMPVFWVATLIIVLKLGTWNSYGMIVGSFFSTVFVLLFYYELLVGKESPPLRSHPEFWVATGMLIFYLPALPFFGTLNYLVAQHREVSKILAVVIMGLDTIMYLLFSYAFLCRIATKKF